MPSQDAAPSAPKAYESPADWAFQQSVLRPLVERRQAMGRGHQKPSIEAVGRMVGLPKSQMGRMEQLAEADAPISGQGSVSLLQVHAWARAIGLAPAVAYDRKGDSFFRDVIGAAQTLASPEIRDLAVRFLRAAGKAPLQIVRSSVEYIETLAATSDAAAVRRQG